MRLALHPGRFAIVRLKPEARIPKWAVQERRGSFVSVTRTEDELSVACDENEVPAGLECSTAWGASRCRGHLISQPWASSPLWRGISVIEE